jgi:hypothetical protein
MSLKRHEFGHARFRPNKQLIGISMKPRNASHHTLGKPRSTMRYESRHIAITPRLPKAPGSQTQVTPTRVIENDLDLFNWLFAELDHCYPRIPVSAIVDNALNGLLESVEGSDCIDYRPAYFHEIFAMISRKRVPPDVPLRGLKLLMFVGRLSAEMDKIGGFVEVPRAWAAEMMLEDTGWLGRGLEYTGGRRRIQSTAAFTREHGVHVNVTLPWRLPRVDSAWDLFAEGITTSKFY